MLPLPTLDDWIATYRSPALLNARPIGLFNPEAKVCLVPFGVISVIIPELPPDATNRLPALSKAKPEGSLNPEAKVLCEPPGVISVMLPLAKFATNKFSAGRLTVITWHVPTQIAAAKNPFVARMFVFIRCCFGLCIYSEILCPT